MKQSIKVLMALILLALPLTFIACGSDDDDGPKLYTYSWEYKNTTPPQTALPDEKAAAAAAESSIDNTIAAALVKIGAAKKTERSYTISGGEQNANDTKVKIAFLGAIQTVLANNMAAALPDGAQVTLKRGSTVLDQENLKN